MWSLRASIGVKNHDAIEQDTDLAKSGVREPIKRSVMTVVSIPSTNRLFDVLPMD